MPLDISRRSVLRAAPGLAAVAALDSGILTPSVARAAPPDPLPGLLAHVERCRAAWLAAGEAHGEDSPEDKAAWEAFMAAEKAVETTVATSPEGVAAQIEYLKGSYVFTVDNVPSTHTDEIPVVFLDVILAGLGRIGQ